MSALVLDTGGWLQALAGDEPYARAVEGASVVIVPSPILPEVDWHLRYRRADMHRVLREIVEGRYLYEPMTAADVKRALEIDRKFADLELGLVDSGVAAIAERLRMRRILTIDKDFSAIRVGRGFREPFELAVPLPSARRARRRR